MYICIQLLSNTFSYFLDHIYCLRLSTGYQPILTFYISLESSWHASLKSQFQLCYVFCCCVAGRYAQQSEHQICLLSRKKQISFTDMFLQIHFLARQLISIFVALIVKRNARQRNINLLNITITIIYMMSVRRAVQRYIKVKIGRGST